MRLRAVAAGMMVLTVSAACTLPSIRVVEDPLTPEEHLSLGVAYEQRGEWDLAIGQYEMARRGPFRARAELYLGNAWFGKGVPATAEEYYRTAMASDPECAEARNNLAWVLVERGGDLGEAEDLARQALALALKAGDTSGAATYTDTLDQIMNRRTGRESREED